MDGLSASSCAITTSHDAHAAHTVPTHAPPSPFSPATALQECDAHVGLQVASLQRSASLDPVTYLDRLDATWRDHCEAMLTIRHIFLYLDRTHVLASGGSGTGAARSLFDMGLQLLGKHLVERPEVRGVVGAKSRCWGRGFMRG